MLEEEDVLEEDMLEDEMLEDDMLEDEMEVEVESTAPTDAPLAAKEGQEILAT